MRAKETSRKKCSRQKCDGRGNGDDSPNFRSRKYGCRVRCGHTSWNCDFRTRHGGPHSTVRIPYQPFQIGDELARMLVTQRTIFLQSFVDDFFQPRRQVGIQAHWADRSPVQNVVEDYSRSIATEWRYTCRHFVKHDSKRKQVRARVEFFASNLLRRHVGDGSERRAGAGEFTRGAHGCVAHHRYRRRVAMRARDFGQTKIKNFGVSSPRNKNVGGLNVAMNNALGVGGLESISNLESQA